MHVMFSPQWWSDIVVVPGVITILGGGLVAFYASVMAIRLTFFYDTQRQAACAVADQGSVLMNQTAEEFSTWCRVTLGRYSTSLRAQNQLQAAVDLDAIAYRICFQFDFLAVCPLDPRMEGDVRERKIITAGIYNAQNRDAWAAEIRALRPDWSEVTRICSLRIIPRKRLRRIEQRPTYTEHDVGSIRWTAKPGE
jgi:hypothetical protein